MLKRLVVLLIYTVIVVGGSFLFRNQPNFDTILYLLTAVSFAISGLSLFSGNTNQSYNLKALEEELFDNEDKKVKSMDIKTIITCIYIAVPFLIAVYLFAN